MKDWLSANFKKICIFVGWTIFAWIIGEIFRPIYSASISAAGQAGNFFVNLFYTIAAKISISILVCCLVLFAVSIPLSFIWIAFCEISKEIKKSETCKQDKNRCKGDKATSLKWIKFYSKTSLCFVTTISIFFFIYILRPMHLKVIYERKITILQAVIPMEQIYKFNARWCLMRSKEDYLRLKSDMDNIEEKYKADLERLSSGE